MKFYIASALENAGNAQRIAEYLVYRGWKQTYDWTAHGLITEKSRLSLTSQKEIQGVMDADVLFLLLPGKRGSHTELGAAIASNTPVVILAMNKDDYLRDSHTCVFYWHQAVRDHLIENNIMDLAFKAHRAGARILRGNSRKRRNERMVV